MVYKEVRQLKARGAWGGGPLLPRAPFRSPYTLSRSLRTRFAAVLRISVVNLLFAILLVFLFTLTFFKESHPKCFVFYQAPSIRARV